MPDGPPITLHLYWHKFDVIIAGIETFMKFSGQSASGNAAVAEIERLSTGCGGNAGPLCLVLHNLGPGIHSGSITKCGACRICCCITNV